MILIWMSCRLVLISRVLLLSLLMTAGFLRAQEESLPSDLKSLRPTAFANTVATVRGQVTCVLDGMFYIQDESDAFPVYRDKASDFVSAGDVIELKCQRKGRASELVLMALEIRKIEARPLPAPIDTTIDAVIRGEHLHRRVRVKGSVHDVAANDASALLMVDENIASIRVSLPSNGTRPDDLLDADVEVTGIALASSRYTSSDRMWATLPTNSADDIKVLRHRSGLPVRGEVYAMPPRGPAGES